MFQILTHSSLHTKIKTPKLNPTHTHTHTHTHTNTHYLPDPDDSICDEDKEDDDGLDEGGGGLLTVLEQSQHLRDT